MFICNNPFSLFWDKQKLDKDYRGAPLHTHNINELYFLLNGSTKYLVCDEVFVLKAGDMVFIPKNTVHQTEYGNNQDVERIVISFTDDFFEEELACYLQEMTKNKHITFDRHGLLKITDLANKIEKESSQAKLGYKGMRRLYFQQLLIMIARYRDKNEPQPLSTTMLQAQQILDYINQNHADDITASSLSAALSVSNSRLSKIFKLATGISIREYVNLTRVSAAKTLLETTDLSVTQVAAKCGFNDSNYFAFMFRKIIGIPPKKYSLLYKEDRLPQK